MSVYLNENATVRLVHEVCCVCAIPYAIPEYFKNQRLEDKKSFYCPNGHGQSYLSETKAERLERELQRERQRRDQAEADANYQRKWRKREVAAAKGQVTKIKNRIQRGVCPCCNRYFDNLKRHMATKHADKGGAPTQH